MLKIDRSARSQVQASPARCLDLLGAVERYPEWASLIGSAQVVEGEPSRVRLRAELMGVGLEMDCALERGTDRVALRRIAHGPDDDERYHATWTLTPAGPDLTGVELHVTAALDAPGPAGLLRGRIERKLVDDLLADFEREIRNYG
ncbi:MAG: hypothetical protein QOF55_150 [Thermoleophilaceae bacterium]|nr:hypothetical protein [Thermoleophilaceae bacterium]